MPAITLASALTDAQSVVTLFGPYLIAGVGLTLAWKFIPKIAKIFKRA